MRSSFLGLGRIRCSGGRRVTASSQLASGGAKLIFEGVKGKSNGGVSLLQDFATSLLGVLQTHGVSIFSLHSSLVLLLEIY